MIHVCNVYVRNVVASISFSTHIYSILVIYKVTHLE